MASKKRKYEDITNKELVQELRTHKAKVSGRKKDLIERYVYRDQAMLSVMTSCIDIHHMSGLSTQPILM